MSTKSIIPPRKVRTKAGNIVYLSAWEVPKTGDRPEGVCYSFQLISNENRVLGYDNNTGEGHHRHYIKNGKLVRETIKFEHWTQVFDIFVKEVEKFEEENENKKD